MHCFSKKCMCLIQNLFIFAVKPKAKIKKIIFLKKRQDCNIEIIATWQSINMVTIKWIYRVYQFWHGSIKKQPFFFSVSERNLRNNNVMFNLLITVTDVKNASLLKNFDFLTKILLIQWCSHWFEFCFLRWFKLNFWSYRSQELHVTHSLLIFSALTCVKSCALLYSKNASHFLDVSLILLLLLHP